MHTITNQKQLRAEFWRQHPTASRKKVDDYTGKRAAMFVCDTRVAFVDFVDHCVRAGTISEALANRATLGGRLMRIVSNELTECRIHRFHARVAIHLNEGQTIYLTAEQADQIAVKLAEFAADIRARKYTHSTLNTWEIKPCQKP